MPPTTRLHAGAELGLVLGRLPQLGGHAAAATRSSTSKASDSTPSSSSVRDVGADARGCRCVISPAAAVSRAQPGADALADDGGEHQGQQRRRRWRSGTGARKRSERVSWIAAVGDGGDGGEHRHAVGAPDRLGGEQRPPPAVRVARSSPSMASVATSTSGVGRRRRRRGWRRRPARVDEGEAPTVVGVGRAPGGRRGSWRRAAGDDERCRSTGGGAVGRCDRRGGHGRRRRRRRRRSTARVGVAGWPGPRRRWPGAG